MQLAELQEQQDKEHEEGSENGNKECENELSQNSSVDVRNCSSSGAYERNVSGTDVNTGPKPFRCVSYSMQGQYIHDKVASQGRDMDALVQSMSVRPQSVVLSELGEQIHIDYDMIQHESLLYFFSRFFIHEN